MSVCLSAVTLVYCGQTIWWIKVPLGTEVGFGPGDIVLDGDPAPPPQKGFQQPPLFGPCLSLSDSRPTAELLFYEYFVL